MEYQQGAIGRVFLVRLDHGENPLEQIRKLAEKENIKNAVFFLIGALKGASLVTGPREAVLPPEPTWFSFNDGRELLGTGTLAWDEHEPLLHIHGASGRGEETVMGCLRQDVEVYLTLEAVVLEISGLKAGRALDPASGFKVLRFFGGPAR